MASSEKSEFPLLDYLDQLVEDLRKLVQVAIEGEDADAVHDARVTTRRLKAATELLEPVVSKNCRRQFDRATRTVRKRLGALRDLDVMIEHLEEVRQHQFKACIEWLKDRMSEDRKRAVGEAQEKADPAKVLSKLGAYWGLRHEIALAKESVDTLLSESVHLQLDAFAEQAQLLAAGQHNDPHQLRIAGKSLRYTLELAKENGRKLPAKVMSLFKRMQSALGFWHDYVVLTEDIMKRCVECDLVLHRPSLQEQMLKLSQITLRKAQAQLRSMSELWKKQGTELCETIRHAFPLTQAVEAVVSPPAQSHQESSEPEGTVGEPNAQQTAPAA
jgi:CHAD domain-containing protein